jgi:D-alanyl-lipoteichoic acid acyltransferase DltB (MBOAT superfamily)
MLFNSFSFLLFFLPAMLLGFFALAGFRHRLAAGWLTLGSLFFYGWWDARYLPLLLGSILFNYLIGTAIARSQSATLGLRARRLLQFGIVADLALLGYFKYCNFFVDNLELLTGRELSNLQVILPIGISFFTFTQIAFLVDTYRREVQEYDLVHYALFVTYFPHLIAGPVLHHKEMMPQFRSATPYRLSSENLVLGLTIFSFGLFKKVLLADNLALYVKPIFDAPAAAGLNFIDAWAASLAYCLQIYFDFSGYSDMAIGLSRLFGIQLPLNFNSPYQAVNISEFWRRWHMTLSRFLRDYLYIPLGGNRHGTLRRYANLGLTMLLGGLWHGAGWTYVIWGGLHGLYLIIHQAWQQWRGPRAQPAGALVRGSSILLTFVAVVFAWVFFRAPSASQALAIVQAMLGGTGLTLPQAWHDSLAGTLGSLSAALLHSGEVAALQDHRLLFIGAGLLWVWLAPNTQKVMNRFEPALDVKPEPVRRAWEWQPTTWWALASALLMASALLNLTQISDFLYFQF